MQPGITRAAVRTQLASGRAFLSVAETARLLGMSEMTLYRAIHAGEFPAVRIRGRIIVPSKAIEAMTAAAMDGGCMVESADWTRPRTSDGVVA